MGYTEIAKKLCDAHPCLKDKRTNPNTGYDKFDLHGYRIILLCQKILQQCVVSANATESPDPVCTAETEKYEENVKALQKLAKGKAAPAQVIQTLLDATRPQRKAFLESSDISIKNILETYPIFRSSKWVCFLACVCVKSVAYQCVCRTLIHNHNSMHTRCCMSSSKPLMGRCQRDNDKKLAENMFQVASAIR